MIVRKKGVEVLHDPWWNKGTSFNYVERDALGLRGLLPPCEIPFQKQIERFMTEYEFGIAHVAPKDETVTPENIRKWKALESLQNRNEVLFYKILLDIFEEMAPIVYSPTVGWCCQVSFLDDDFLQANTTMDRADLALAPLANSVLELPPDLQAGQGPLHL